MCQRQQRSIHSNQCCSVVRGIVPWRSSVFVCGSCWCGSRRLRPIAGRPVRPDRKAGPRATRGSGAASRRRAGPSASPCRRIRRSRPLRSAIASTDVPERAAFRISISSSRRDPVQVRLRPAPDSGTGQDRQTDPITFRSTARSARTRRQPAQWRSAIFPDAVTAAGSGRRQKTKRENERRHTRHTIRVDQSLAEQRCVQISDTRLIRDWTHGSD